MTPDIDIDINWEHSWEREYTTINRMIMWFNDTGDGRKRKTVSITFSLLVLNYFYLSYLLEF